MIWKAWHSSESHLLCFCAGPVFTCHSSDLWELANLIQQDGPPPYYHWNIRSHINETLSGQHCSLSIPTLMRFNPLGFLPMEVPEGYGKNTRPWWRKSKCQNAMCHYLSRHSSHTWWHIISMLKCAYIFGGPSAVYFLSCAGSGVQGLALSIDPN
jgi:hypothetical protein